MKTLYSALVLGLAFGALNQAIADDEQSHAFTKKSGDHGSHVVGHAHAHPAEPVKAESFKNRGENVAAKVEVHGHAHPEVRDAPGHPEPYIRK